VAQFSLSRHELNTRTSAYFRSQNYCTDWECGNAVACVRFVVCSFVQHNAYCTAIHIYETQ